MLLLMLGLLTTSGGALDDSQSPKVQCEMLWRAEFAEGMLQLVAWPLLHITAGQLYIPDSLARHVAVDRTAYAVCSCPLW